MISEKLSNIINETVINEYFTSDVSYLKKYLTMSDDEKAIDAAYIFSNSFNDFIDENYSHNLESKKIGKEYLKKYYREEDLYSDIENMVEDNKDLAIEFGTWVIEHAFYNPRSYGYSEIDVPTWYYLDYIRDVKNEWLIHFTETKQDAFDIAKNGFKYGTEEIEKLGLTTWFKKETKKHGGFDFAYTPREAHKNFESRHDSSKYGKNGVIFIASGVEAYHSGDVEKQVLFYGNTARNIIPFYEDSETNKLTIENINTDRKIAEFKYPSDMVEWVKTNYPQYQKAIRVKQ